MKERIWVRHNWAPNTGSAILNTCKVQTYKGGRCQNRARHQGCHAIEPPENGDVCEFHHGLIVERGRYDVGRTG